jgi:hypothetical protein
MRREERGNLQTIPKRYRPRATQAIRASEELGIQKLNPVKNKHRDMRGKVVRSRLRRPKVSMVYTAGMAKRKLITPQPREAPRALISERFASRNISLE